MASVTDESRPFLIFDDISYQGVLDLRVIVFLGVLVMSMVRPPTRISGGEANLHQGAIGASSCKNPYIKVRCLQEDNTRSGWHNFRF
jgi:hypothetical protein